MDINVRLAPTAVIADGSPHTGTTVALAERPIVDLRPGDIVAVGVWLACMYGTPTDRVHAFDTVTKVDELGAHLGPAGLSGTSYLAPDGDCYLIVDGLTGMNAALVEADSDDLPDDFKVDETTCAAAGCDEPVGWILTGDADEKAGWANCFVDQHGRIFCEEIHGG